MSPTGAAGGASCGGRLSRAMKDMASRTSSASFDTLLALWHNDGFGEFSFENLPVQGLLQSGETYEAVAQSPGGLYKGKTSFKFSGTEDIRWTIPLTQMNWLELAQQR